jgi:aspartate/glutamate racemase
MIQKGVLALNSKATILLNQRDTKAPLFDTTMIHGKRAALFAIGK